MSYSSLIHIGWRQWLQSPIALEDGTSITVQEWAQELILYGILPHFQQVGYILHYNPHEAIETFLNFLYRFKNNYKKNVHSCSYRGKKGDPVNYLNDDFEFFCTKKCPPSFWSSLQYDFSIPIYADNSDFATKLWMDIPYFIFYLVDIAHSNAKQELEEHLAWYDEEEEDTTNKKKKDIDPYLLDYGGPKYKNYDNQ